MQKVLKLVTEVVQSRTGLTAQAGLPAFSETDRPEQGQTDRSEAHGCPDGCTLEER